MRFRKLATIGVLALTTLYSQDAFSIQKKRDFSKGLGERSPVSEPIITTKRPVISSKWEKGSCSVIDQNTILYTAGKEKHKLVVSVPVYQGKEKPVDISCSSKRTVVLTTKKIVTFAGYDAVKGSDNMVNGSMNQDLGKAAKEGIVSGEINGKDIFVITRNNELWYTNLDDPEKMFGFKVDRLGPGTKKMEIHKNVLFIAQNAPARGDFLLAVVMDGDDIVFKGYAMNYGSRGKIRIKEKGDYLELRIGEDVHRVSVRENGKLNSISVSLEN